MLQDLVVIGGGLSGSRLVINVLDALLAREPPPRPLRIAVLDRLGAFGAGIPYGRQTTQAGFLLLETVAQSTPEDFQLWLRDPASTSVESSEAVWLEAHRARLASGQFGDLFVPRRVFGAFARRELNARIALAAERGAAQVTLVQTEAEDVRGGAPWQVETLHGGLHLARMVILAMGCIPAPPRFGLSDAGGYVHDLYRDGLEVLSTCLRERAGLGRALEVAILGSGASASEVIHQLARTPELLALVGNIHVISSSGRLAGTDLEATIDPDASARPSPSRPSARDYVDSARRLASAGRLFLHRGWIGKSEPIDSSRLRLYFRAGGERSSVEADVIVECTGPGQIGRTTSTLLQNLAAPGRPFKPNPSGEGFVLRPGTFEIEGAEDLFVLGPLLNRTPGEHVESIRAVYRTAEQLAPAILERLIRASRSAIPAARAASE